MSRENQKPTRKIHLGVYAGALAEGILGAVKTAALKYGSRMDERSFGMIDFDAEPDGEIVMSVYASGYNRNSVFSYHKDTSDQRVKEWLAGVVKGVVKKALFAAAGDHYLDIHQAEIRACEKWSRDNAERVPVQQGHNVYTGENSYVDVDVPAAYALYEMLKGRLVKAKRFSDGLLSKTFGEARDPVQTELEIARREEIAKIEKKFADTDKAINEWADHERSRIWQEMDERRKRNKLEKEAALKALDEQLKAALEVA